VRASTNINENQRTSAKIDEIDEHLWKSTKISENVGKLGKHLRKSMKASENPWKSANFREIPQGIFKLVGCLTGWSISLFNLGHAPDIFVTAFGQLMALPVLMRTS